jgi:hypothetical protein
MSKKKRKSLTLKVKLATALLALRYPLNGDKLIPHEDARLMTADQIISLFQWHHYPIPHEEGGPDEPWNLEPVMIKSHRRITAKETAPRRAKIRRTQERWADFVAKMQEKAGLASERVQKKEKRKIPSRPFPKKKKP